MIYSVITTTFLPNTTKLLFLFSVDKIIIKCNALSRVIATDNWIIRVLPYTINVAHQSDAALVVTSSDSYLYVPDRPEGGQYLTIDVKSSRSNVGGFQIR